MATHNIETGTTEMTTPTTAPKSPTGKQDRKIQDQIGEQVQNAIGEIYLPDNLNNNGFFQKGHCYMNYFGERGML